MKRPGFTLIEVIIGSLVSSLLLSALYLTINTLSRTMFQLNDRHDQAHDLMILYDMLEKDLTSQYVALDLLKTGSQQIDPENGFVCLTKDKKIEYVSCVTMHPRPEYNVTKFSPVRVVYQFNYLPNTESAQLQRYESRTLAWNACKKEIDDKKIKGLTLIDTMHDVDLAIFAQSRVEKPKEEAAAKEITKLKQWEPQDIYKKTKRLIPDSITWEGKLGTDVSRALDFVFDFTIPVHDPEVKEGPAPQPQSQPTNTKPNQMPQPPVPKSSASAKGPQGSGGSANIKITVNGQAGGPSAQP